LDLEFLFSSPQTFASQSYGNLSPQLQLELTKELNLKELSLPFSISCLQNQINFMVFNKPFTDKTHLTYVT